MVVLALTGWLLKSVPVRFSDTPDSGVSAPLKMPSLLLSVNTRPLIWRPAGTSAKSLATEAVAGGRMIVAIWLGSTIWPVAVPAVPPLGTVPARVLPLAVPLGCVGSRTV